MEKHFTEGKNKVEDKPQVNHFDIGGGRQRGGDVDEHGGEDQHYCEVYSHHSLGKKKKIKYKK